MNYCKIDDYMHKHDFLPADIVKIHSYINNKNFGRKGKHKIVDGYLTRDTLYLITGYGTTLEVPRLFLGIQENFK